MSTTPTHPKRERSTRAAEAITRNEAAIHETWADGDDALPIVSREAFFRRPTPAPAAVTTSAADSQADGCVECGGHGERWKLAGKPSKWCRVCFRAKIQAGKPKPAVTAARPKARKKASRPAEVTHQASAIARAVATLEDMPLRELWTMHCDIREAVIRLLDAYEAKATR